MFARCAGPRSSPGTPPTGTASTARDSVSGTSGSVRRVKRRTAASTLGGGANALRVKTPRDLDLVERSPEGALQRRRPDGGVFLGEAPLTITSAAGDRPAEQVAQDRARAREGQVRNDRERLGRQRQSRTSASTTETAPPNRSPRRERERRVPLDRDDSGADLQERPREYSRARTDVDDEVVLRDSGFADESGCQPAATKKVLAASAPGGASSDGHDKPPWSCGHCTAITRAGTGTRPVPRTTVRP